MDEIIIKRIEESIAVKQGLLRNENLLEKLDDAAHVILDCLKNGNKIVLCGNGGSASDALHFAGEIVGRFQKERVAWPAVVLNADVATMTAIANDYSYNDVFARQAEGHVNSGDVFIGISTSGNSENVLRALEVAKSKGGKTIVLVGKDGGKLSKVADCSLVVPCMVTARVQECHIMLIHIMCEMVENMMCEEVNKFDR